MARITLTGHILVPPPDLDAIIAELPNDIRLTQAEPGCLSFTVTQSTTDPHRFGVEEQFESRDALEGHQARFASSHWGSITLRVERHYQVTNDTDRA